jgi:hypothetical protein
MRSLIKPHARADELVVRDLDDEVLVYDLNKHEAVTLNSFAAAVWRACDGTRTVSELGAKLQDQMPGSDVPEESIWGALDMLSQCDLLEERVMRPAQQSRRDLIKVMGKGAIALPIVTMIVVPTPAHAASCACVTPGDCLVQTACPSTMNCNSHGMCAP